MSDFNLRNFLTENKLTSNSKKLNELESDGRRFPYDHDDVAFVRILSDVDEDDFQAHITGKDERGEYVIQQRAPETIDVLIEVEDGTKRELTGNFLDVGIAAPINEPDFGEDGFEQFMEFWYYDLPLMEDTVLQLRYPQRASNKMDIDVIHVSQMDTGVFF